MDSKITSTKRGSGAFTITEMLIGVGITALLLLVVWGFSMFCSRSFAALYNYVDLDDVNRVAIDQLTRDVRGANFVNYYETNGTVLGLDYGNATNSGAIRYEYDPVKRTLTRTTSGTLGDDSKIVLRECDQLAFRLGQRNTDVGGYNVFPVADDISIAKVINVSWVCSRSLFGQKENTESVQTARIVIRKQGS